MVTLNQPEMNSPLKNEKRALPRVRSGSHLAAIMVEAKDGNIKEKESKFKQEVRPDEGYDLSMIHTHYQHRRTLR